MSAEVWGVFALFWVLFVTTPGPNAVNCIGNGMTHGFARSLWGLAGILTQATLFLFLSAAGVTALLVASPAAFLWAKLAGAAVLIWLGVRGWIAAARPVAARDVPARSIYGRAFFIATFNAKSVAGYLAAFSQFVQPDVPIGQQMTLIVPTALAITATKPGPPVSLPATARETSTMKSPAPDFSRKAPKRMNMKTYVAEILAIVPNIASSP